METSRLVPQLPLPPAPYVPGVRGVRPALPIRTALAADGAETAGFSLTLFRYGIDAFHAGYCWEAHECWEELWRREPRGSARRALLQGLILLAAARVKAAQGKPWGAEGLHRRALARLAEAGDQAPGLPVDLAALRRDAGAAGPAGPLRIRGWG